MNGRVIAHPCSSGSWLIAALIAQLLVTGAAHALTTVTTFTYNVDGELTAVAKQIDQKEPETTYLTWDNFVPDAKDPSTGQVLRDDGRLRGIGPSPGSFDETFTFDPRDRLLSYSGPAGDESFDYNANGSMSSSSVAADELRFFYDYSGNAKVTNIHQAATDLWSAYLGGVRYLDDGSEEVLLEPRKKDVACSYEPDGEALQSYVYDAYGASALVPPPDGTYDLGENPFRYAGEYRDPIWGGYYLRARWYHPELTVFLSRDPMRNLSRYGYARGNPVMRVDPSGFKFNYMRDIGNPTGSLLKRLNHGVLGHVWRVLYAPLAGPMEIIANPGGFWHAIEKNQGNIDVFITLGVVTEVAGGFLDAGFASLGTSYARRFLSRSVGDTLLGAGQSISAASTRGFHHFDWNTFAQGLEYTASVIGYRRFIAGGVNVRRTGIPQARVVQLANDADRAPPETSLLSGSRSSSSNRGSFDAPPPMDDSNQLNVLHDDLLHELDPENVQREALEQSARDLRRDFREARNEVQSAEKMVAKARRRQGAQGLRSNIRTSAIPVSRKPILPGINEYVETPGLFANQAEVHAGYVVDALEEE